MIKEHPVRFLTMPPRSSFIVAAACIRLIETVGLLSLLSPLSFILFPWLSINDSFPADRSAIKHSAEKTGHELSGFEMGLLSIYIPLTRTLHSIQLQPLKYTKKIEGHFTSGINRTANREAMLGVLCAGEIFIGHALGICLIWSAFRDFHFRDFQIKGIKLWTLTAGIAIFLVVLGIPDYYNWLVFKNLCASGFTPTTPI